MSRLSRSSLFPYTTLFRSVDVFDAPRGFRDQRFETGCYRRTELDAQRLRTYDRFLRIGDICRRDLVGHFGGGVAEHALGAHVENLNDTLRVGRDAREVRAVENRALQGPRFQERVRAAGICIDVFRRAWNCCRWHGD